MMRNGRRRPLRERQRSEIAPATGVTVYPCFVFGKGGYGIVELDNIEWNYLAKADKSDPANQLRVVAWKFFEGVLISNVQFLMRIEAASAFASTFG